MIKSEIYTKYYTNNITKFITDEDSFLSNELKFIIDEDLLFASIDRTTRGPRDDPGRFGTLEIIKIAEGAIIRELVPDSVTTHRFLYWKQII